MVTMTMMVVPDQDHEVSSEHTHGETVRVSKEEVVQVQEQKCYPLPCSTHQQVVRDKSLFLTTLEGFLAALGSDLRIPEFGGKDLDLYGMYCEVTKRGGIEQVIRNAQWNTIVDSMNVNNVRVPSASFVVWKHYMDLLFHYEQAYYHRKKGKIQRPPLSLSMPNIAAAPANTSSCHENPLKMMAKTEVEKPRSGPLHNFGVDPASSIGASALGVISGEVEGGYLITVVVDGQKLSGILYPALKEKVKLPATVTGLVNLVGRDWDPLDHEVQLYKKRKQPGVISPPPRRTRTGYNIYLKEQRARLLELNHKSKGLGKKVIEMWNKLPEDEKAVYVERGFHERERLKRESLELQGRSHNNQGRTEGSESSLGNGTIDDASHDYHVSLLDVSGEEASLDNGKYDARHDYHVSLSGGDSGHGSPAIHRPPSYEAARDHTIAYEIQGEAEEEKAACYNAPTETVPPGANANNRRGHHHNNYSRMQEIISCPLSRRQHVTVTHDTLDTSPSQRPTLVHDNHMVSSQATANRVVTGGGSPYAGMMHQSTDPYLSVPCSNQSLSWNLGNQTRSSCLPTGFRPQGTYYQNMPYHNDVLDKGISYRPAPMHLPPPNANQKFSNESHRDDCGSLDQAPHQQIAEERCHV